MIVALTLALAASADAPESFAGLPVQSVQIVAEGGGVPDESLDPLLRVHQGDPLDLLAVRLDLGTLYNAGAFEAVEADAELWPAYDEDGNIVDGVLIRYRVVPSPRIGRVSVSGEDGLRERDLVDAAGLGIGERFTADVDSDRVAERIRRAYATKGYVGTQVVVAAKPLPKRFGRHRVEIVVEVVEGVPHRVQDLVISGDLPVSEARIRAIARRAGVAPGRPFTAEALEAAQYRIRADLAGKDRWFGIRPGGWIEARVTAGVGAETDATPEEGDLDVLIRVESGRRLVLDVDGIVRSPRRKVRDALDIDERLRLTAGFLDGAPERIESYFQRKGFYEAKAQVSLDRNDDALVLHVDVERGPRWYLSPPFGNPRIEVEGASALTEAEIRNVMMQTSYEVLRLGSYTDSEAALALAAVREVYVANGHPDAHLEIIELERGHALLSGVRLTVHVRVEEGPEIRLSSLDIAGSAEDVDMTAIAGDAQGLEGGPFSPQKIDALARRAVDVHRAEGYLEADARVVTARDELGRVDAHIEVIPGPRVVLRSFVATGLRRTDADFLRRQVQLVPGSPLRTADLEALRRSMYDLGIFRTVETQLLGDGPQRDLILDVRERPRWAFELGSGVSTDQGLRGFGRVSRNNLWGRAHRAELFGLLGVDWRSDSLADWRLDLADPEWRAAGTYSAPRFPWRGTELTLDVLFRELDVERTWKMTTTGIGAGLESHFGKKTTVRFGVRTEDRRLLDVDPGAILPGEPWAELVNDEGSLELPSAWREQSEVSLLVLHDRRDDPLEPTRGILAQGEVSFGPGVRFGPWKDVLSPPTTIAAEGRFAAYAPIGPLILHIAARGARAHAFGGATVPLEMRYRLGGTGTLRGFRRDSVGPKNEVEQPTLEWPDSLGPVIGEALRTDSTRWVSTGGDALASGTAEVLVPFTSLGMPGWDGYAAAVFVDGGDTWLLDSTSTSELPQYRAIFDPALRWSGGVGVRVLTPVGPLQIDVAANPAAMFAEGEKKTLLRDEWEETPLRAHLALGTLF